ncbi:Protein of unknown function (DUF3072) [Abditibacterium utsteinense]|uniref:DUF3072 domain-containing protein n=1 Tax=Abditibacterium utsteinense TaxID=1960156 RepID=A0A2S8SPE3_9BACT|nr:DUF3072 domain-containing protein [Abditibacterium utsteinense]PQV62649.1 Protein of unknown function (DUF3072) [Abditibacterium utsteinense]
MAHTNQDPKHETTQTAANKTEHESANAIDSAENSNAIKDPDTWTTGDEPMTGAQKSYLKTLSDQAGEEMDETLSKGDASKKIDDLQHKTGRGAA